MPLAPSPAPTLEERIGALWRELKAARAAGEWFARVAAEAQLNHALEELANRARNREPADE